jgi:hypothetical protein
MSCFQDGIQACEFRFDSSGLGQRWTPQRANEVSLRDPLQIFERSLYISQRPLRLAAKYTGYNRASKRRKRLKREMRWLAMPIQGARRPRHLFPERIEFICLPRAKLTESSLPPSLWFRTGRDLFELVKKLLVGRGAPSFG